MLTLLHHMPWMCLLWIILMAFLFAQLEIQIEGPHGWASHLPTWRLPATSPLRLLFGGRHITGYHVFAFSFMALAFHWPLALFGHCSLPIEARILASLALFWILEDFLWFVLNPAYGLSRFKQHHIPWHPHWFCGVPVDYLVMSAIAITLFAYSVWATTPRSL